MSAKIYQFDLKLKEDFRLVSQKGDKRSYTSTRRYCPRCGKIKTDHAYFSSQCFKSLGKENKQ